MMYVLMEIIKLNKIECNIFQESIIFYNSYIDLLINCENLRLKNDFIVLFYSFEQSLKNKIDKLKKFISTL